MPAAPPNPAATETWILSALVLALAVFLGVRQWLETRRRESEQLVEAEARHLSGRDRRRWAVASILALIGVAMMASTAIPVRQSREAARLWAWTWVGALVLTVILLVLALLDWLASASEARRQVRDLSEEQQALLSEAIRAHREFRRKDSENPDGRAL